MSRSNSWNAQVFWSTFFQLGGPVLFPMQKWGGSLSRAVCVAHLSQSWEPTAHPQSVSGCLSCSGSLHFGSQLETINVKKLKNKVTEINYLCWIWLPWPFDHDHQIILLAIWTFAGQCLGEHHPTYLSSTWIGDGVTSLINKWITNPENWVYLLAPSWNNFMYICIQCVCTYYI